MRKRNLQGQNVEALALCSHDLASSTASRMLRPNGEANLRQRPLPAAKPQFLEPDYECERLSMPFGIKRKNCTATTHPFVGPMNALIAQSAGDCDVSLDRYVVRADDMSKRKHCNSAEFTSLTFIPKGEVSHRKVALAIDAAMFKRRGGRPQRSVILRPPNRKRLSELGAVRWCSAMPASSARRHRL
jgi:hypothetical protein